VPEEDDPAPPIDDRPAPVRAQDATGAARHGPFERLNRRKLVDVHWDEGLWLFAEPKRFSMRLNLRMDIDSVSIDDSAYANRGGRFGSTESDGTMRRARVTLRGVIGKYGVYKTSLETTDQAASLRDNYFEWSGLNDHAGGWAPRIRMGNFFEPFSLEQTTPSSRLTFMERSAATQAFGIGRGLGIMIYDELNSTRAGYDLGAFLSPSQGLGDFANRVSDDALILGGVGVTGRIWWLPGYDCACESRRWLVGASVSQRLDLSGIRIRARPESFSLEHLIDTDFSTDAAGTPLLDDATSATLVGADTLWIRGPWSVQAEYFLAHVASKRAGNPTFHGGYAFVSYFLTGEHRVVADGRIQASRICSPLDSCDDKVGFGALELAARYSVVDLNDANVRGGSMHNLSLELNWYLAERRRVLFNFIRAQVDDGRADAPIYIFQVRLQLEL
jgi:phosphate-selective porin OprO/OprP